MKMHHLTKKALFALAGMALVSSAKAQYTPNNNDLLLGFTSSSSSADLVIDLGTPSNIGVGGTTVVGLGGDLSLNQLNTLFGSLNNLETGVVGASFGNVYSTVFRNGPDNFASPNSLSPPPLIGNSTIGNQARLNVNTAGSDITSGNQAVVAHGDGTEWSAQINPASGSKVLNAFAINYNNPDSVTPANFVSSGGFLYEDLYVSTTTSETYLGYFSLSSGAGLSFTPAATVAPEPSSYALFGAAAGLSLLSIRRKFSLKQTA
jgi:hypothetical protein